MAGKYAILLSFILITFGLKAQSYTYTYTDPCTGILQSVTINQPTGTVTMFYAGQYQTFTAIQLASGGFENWVAQINAQFPPGTNPCAGNGSTNTNNFNTQLGNNTANNITNIVSIATSVAGSTGAGIPSGGTSTNDNGGGSNDQGGNSNTGTSGGSTGGTSGGSGGISYISLQPSTSEQTLICKSSTLAATSAQVAGAAGGTISVVSLSAFGNLGLFTAIAGVNGSSGGANTGGAGVSQAALGTNLTTGGAGGGGATNTAGVWASGGSITAASAILTTQVSGGQTVGADGNSGYGTLQPFCGTGGSGGAGRDGSTGAGGNGGNGFYGCGAGGAGGSSTVVPRGGNGGDGLVIITVIT